MDGLKVLFDCGWCGVLWICVNVCGVVKVVVYGLLFHPGWVGLYG